MTQKPTRWVKVRETVIHPSHRHTKMQNFRSVKFRRWTRNNFKTLIATTLIAIKIPRKKKLNFDEGDKGQRNWGSNWVGVLIFQEVKIPRSKFSKKKFFQEVNFPRSKNWEKKILKFKKIVKIFCELTPLNKFFL